MNFSFEAAIKTRRPLTENARRSEPCCCDRDNPAPRRGRQRLKSLKRYKYEKNISYLHHPDVHSSSALTSRAQTAHTEDISKESNMESVIQKGVSDGDMQKLAQAHVTMSNLEWRLVARQARGQGAFLARRGV